MIRHETFEAALGACMATLAQYAQKNATMHALKAGARGAINAWATEYLTDGTPIYVTLSVQRGEHQPTDRVAGYTLETDGEAGPDVFPARRQRALPKRPR